MNKIIVQGTPEWYEARLGCFTSSEIHRLMTEPKDKSAQLSQGAITYIEEKLDEIMTGQYKEFENEAMAWGKTYEEAARLEIEARYGIETMLCGFVRHPDMAYYGDSSDGFMIPDKVKYAIEIKCPFLPKEHRRHIREMVSVEIFKSKAPNDYWQCMSHMEVMKADKCLFVSYHPIFNDAHKYRSLIIDRNEQDISAMKSKIKLAHDYLIKEAESFGIDILNHIKIEA